MIWETIREEATTSKPLLEVKKIDEFLKYFDGQWMNNPSPQINTKIWNIYDRSGDRTNNYCESWHSKYIKKTSPHPNIFLFIEFLTNYHIQVKLELNLNDSDIFYERPRKNRKTIMMDSGIEIKKKTIKKKQNIFRGVFAGCNILDGEA